MTNRQVWALLKENQCIANKENGILFDSAAHGTVESNICKYNEKHGIAVLGNLSAPELKENQLIDNKAGEVFYEMGVFADARQLLQ